MGWIYAFFFQSSYANNERKVNTALSFHFPSGYQLHYLHIQEIPTKAVPEIK